MLGYAITTALSSLFIQHTNTQVPALVAAFYTFCFCLLAYNLFNSQLIMKIKLIKLYWREVGMLNITTAICWSFTFLALNYIPAALYLFVYLSAMPIAGAFVYRHQRLKATGLLVCLLVLVHSYHIPTCYLGASLAFLGGISGTFYSYYSKKIAPVFSTNEILALRFYMLVMTTFALSFIFGNFHMMPQSFYLQFALLAIISVIIPMTLFQVGIKHLHLTKALAYLPLAPLICYAVNYFFHHQTTTPVQLSIIFIIAIFMLI